MKRMGFVVLLSATLLGFGTGRVAVAATEDPLGGPTAGPTSELEHRLQSRLAHDPLLKDNKIDVTVVGDTATLRGTVDSEAERERASRLALTGPIRRVNNELNVGSAGAKAAVSDSALTAQIKTRLVAEWGLRANDIHVSTNNGVVTLSGAVANEAMHDRAIELARSNSGVKRVDDQLVLQDKPQEMLK